MTQLPLAPSESSPRAPWLRVKAPSGPRYRELRGLLERHRLHTVCHSAACPNIGECWDSGTATFMILGNVCTRACRFCDVKTATTPGPVDLDEPARLARAVALMGLSYVVITSVARDDLDDGGAAQFARCIAAVKEAAPGARVEVLVPDFLDDERAVRAVLDAGPAVFNHNLETVRRLTPKVRSRAAYARSLSVLARAKRLAPQVRSKSGLMLGLGERDDEVREAIADLRAAGVEHLTLGQYLRPSPWHLPVDRMVPPAEFDALADHARGLGFSHVVAGPMVRSSYHAAEQG